MIKRIECKESFVMKTNILFFILTVGLINAGCSSLSKSNIFKSFSLQSTVSKTGYKNIDCSKGTGGDGADAEGFAFGRGGTENMQPSSIRCEIIQVGNKEFSESDFIDAFLREVEKEIKAGGGTLTSSSRPSLSSFIVGYEVKGRQGKINVSGKRDGSAYHLRGEISEWTK
jgi:hypothetical protein